MAVKALKAISFGKYPTTLYNKSGTTYHASVIGGITSIAFIVGFCYLLIVSLVEIFQRVHYNVNISSSKIDAYLYDENYTLLNETACTAPDECKQFKMKDINSLFEPADIIL